MFLAEGDAVMCHQEAVCGISEGPLCSSRTWWAVSKPTPNQEAQPQCYPLARFPVCHKRDSSRQQLKPHQILEALPVLVSKPEPENPKQRASGAVSPCKYGRAVRVNFTFAHSEAVTELTYGTAGVLGATPQLLRLAAFHAIGSE